MVVISSNLRLSSIIWNWIYVCFRPAAGAVTTQREILAQLHSSPTADKPDLLLLHVTYCITKTAVKYKFNQIPAVVEADHERKESISFTCPKL